VPDDRQVVRDVVVEVGPSLGLALERKPLPTALLNSSWLDFTGTAGHQWLVHG